jgi:hypothetical protein
LHDELASTKMILFVLDDLGILHVGIGVCVGFLKQNDPKKPSDSFLTRPSKTETICTFPAPS